MSESGFRSMQFQSGVNNEMLSQFMDYPEPNKEVNEEELEVKRKYYEKPNTDPMGVSFLQNFVQGM